MTSGPSPCSATCKRMPFVSTIRCVTSGIEGSTHDAGPGLAPSGSAAAAWSGFAKAALTASALPACSRSRRENVEPCMALPFDCRTPVVIGAPLGLGGEHAQRHQWADWNELVVHQFLLAQGKAVHDRTRFADIPGIQQENDSAAVATRIPFANLPIEIELQGLLDFSGHDGHHLFACDAGFHGNDDDHAGGCGREGLGLGLGNG